MFMAFYYKDLVIYNNNFKESLHGNAALDRVMTWFWGPLIRYLMLNSPFGGVVIEICNVLL